jgi:hypothetical protein
VLVGYAFDSVRQERSEDEPLEATVRTPSTDQGAGAPNTSLTEYGADGFELLVTDASRLPANIAEINDCARLWEVGRSAGGTPVERSEPPDLSIELKGRSETGMRVVGLRAKVPAMCQRPTAYFWSAHLNLSPALLRSRFTSRSTLTPST